MEEEEEERGNCADVWIIHPTQTGQTLLYKAAVLLTTVNQRWAEQRAVWFLPTITSATRCFGSMVSSNGGVATKVGGSLRRLSKMTSNLPECCSFCSEFSEDSTN